MTVLHGDCREIMRTMPNNSVDAIITDPPYELGFMGKSWDSTGIAYDVTVWQECLRVLKPGGHLLAFGGSRTYHRLACAIEDAGFQIRDQIMWVYGSGFPKSLNIGKAIDKAAGAERTEVIGIRSRNVKPFDDSNGWNSNNTMGKHEYTAPATAEAKQWDGWGTALKPAHEPIVMARKPLDGTVAQTVLTHGTGGINIDGCRVGYASETDQESAHYNALGMDRLKRDYGDALGSFDGGWKKKSPTLPTGRFPANFIHDGSDEVLELFPDTGKSQGGRIGKKSMSNVTNVPAGRYEAGDAGYGDSSSAARFFYCAKANKKDRNEGLDDFTDRARPTMGNGIGGQPNQQIANNKNYHPTVKPTDLMRYLCRLVTPPNGTILDPFTGSGSTGKAATLEGFNFIGIEQSAEYVEIATARIRHAKENNEN